MTTLVVTKRDGKFIAKCTGEPQCRKHGNIYNSRTLPDGVKGHCYHNLEVDEGFFQPGVGLERCAGDKTFVYAANEYETIVEKTDEKNGVIKKGKPKDVHIFK